jgi:hypothetical protein
VKNNILFIITTATLLLYALIETGLSSENDGPPLPRHIFLKTATETFTYNYYIALHRSKIWIKPNEVVTGRKGPWKLFPPGGVPCRDGIFGFESPDAVVSITADGENLIATGRDRTVYYAKLYDFKWTVKWGFFPKKRLYLPEDNLALAISHRGKDRIKYYEDIMGGKHYSSVGVSTLYLLKKNGLGLFYADPWLPARFGHQIAMPLKGRFVAVNMSASGSTLFVINNRGDMYTRLYDYDTSGQNPVLKYTFDKNSVKSGAENEPRVLPPEGWRKQPPIKGRITNLITILQNGEGNASRELRVEGIDPNGTTGYYFKPLLRGTWRFQKTGHAMKGPFLPVKSAGSSLLGPVITRTYSGSIRSFFGSILVRAKLSDFSFLIGSGTVTVLTHGREIPVPVYMRRIIHGRNGTIMARGALDISKMARDSDPTVKALWNDCFGGKKLIRIKVLKEGNKIQIKYANKRMIFHKELH